jgi:prepilin-type N-terminal cleavage/methylation domain-containing protein
MSHTKKGFTLIELLIVIGILAILATTVVLVLNPAQILQETRDTQRISDLASVQSAIGLYLATASSIDMDDAFTPATGCGITWWSSGDATIAANQPFETPAVPVASQTLGANVRDVDGDGWIPIDLAQVSGGSPLASLPQDPSVNDANPLDDPNTPGYFYAYQCINVGVAGGPSYEINGNMESTKFGNGGSSDVESNDGGDKPDIYEVGNSAGLAL